MHKYVHYFMLQLKMVINFPVSRLNVSQEKNSAMSRLNCVYDVVILLLLVTPGNKNPTVLYSAEVKVS